MPSFSGQRDQGIRPFQSGQQRIYIQINPKPTSEIMDYGLTELGQITFATPEPEQILVPDRKSFNKWKRIGRVFQPDEFQSVDFTTTANGAGKDDWEDLRKLQVEFVIYNTVGAVSEGQSIQADDAHSWTQKGVLPDCLVVSVSPFGESINSKSENSESMATGSIQYGNGVIARTVEFASIGGAALTKDILDGFTINRGSFSEFFGITTNAPASAPSSVIYGRTDRPTAFTQTNITALSTDGLTEKAYLVGNSMMLLRNTSTLSHYFSSLDDVRAGNDIFTEVTGYTAAKGPLAACVLSEGNIIVVGTGGYIYRLTNITTAPSVVDAGVLTTNALNDVDFYNSQVVAVGASNTVLVSQQGGINGWSSITGPSVGNALTAVSVVRENQWYIGTDNGEIWFGEYDPVDGTAVWTQLNPFGLTTTAIVDIDFHEDSKVFGWVVDETGLLRTTSAGVRFSAKSPEFVRLSNAGITTYGGVATVDENEVFVFGDAGNMGLGQ